MASLAGVLETLAFGFSLVAAAALAVGCSAPSAETEAAEEQAGALDQDGATLVATCNGMRHKLVRDERRPTEAFGVLVSPDHAVRLYVPAGAASGVVSVKGPDGKQRPLRFGSYMGAMPVFANTWREPKRYDVTLERLGSIDFDFDLACYPIVSSPTHSGILDDVGMCKAGEACLFSEAAVGGASEIRGTCANGSFPNLGNDWSVGFCHR